MGLLDTIRANKVNADKAQQLDNLEKGYVANQVAGQKAELDASKRFIDQLMGRQFSDVMNQEGLASEGALRANYNDGISPEDAYKLRLIKDAEMKNAGLAGSYK